MPHLPEATSLDVEEVGLGQTSRLGGVGEASGSHIAVAEAERRQDLALDGVKQLSRSLLRRVVPLRLHHLDHEHR